MLWLQRHSTATLYTIYALTVILMIFCIIIFYYYAIIDLNRPEGSHSHPFYITEYSLMFFVFFGTANAMVIFRMFSLNLITLIVHALIHGVVVVCLIVHLVLFHNMQPVKSFYHSYWVQVYVMLAVYILQCLLALDLIIFKPGKTALQREKRSGMHAFIGVITFVVVFWNMTLMISMLCITPDHSRSADSKLSYGELLTEPSFLIVLVAIYMLLILFILLTPFFRADARELSATEEECMIESDLAEFNAQLLQAGYLSENEEEDDKKAKEKRKNIPRQDLMVLTVSQTSIGGRHRNSLQDSHVDQMKYRLEEVWKADPVLSHTSLEENSCRYSSPPPSKCTPLRRVEKIRRRGAASPQCLMKKEPQPKCGCSKPCQSPNRCRSRFPSGSTAAPQKHVSRSCSQVNLTSTICRRCSPKSSSAPCNKCEEDDWHLIQFEQSSLTSFEERNLYGSSRGSRLKTALTSEMDISLNDYCSCSKAQTTDDKDLPFGICSTTSQIDLAIDRLKCIKTAARNKTEEDLSRHCKAAKTPATKPIQKCMSCGRCSIPLEADNLDAKPTCSKATPTNNIARPKKIRGKKNVPTGKLATTSQLESANISRGRYFSPSYRTKIPQATRSGIDTQLTSAPPAKNWEIVAQSEKVSTPSQTDVTCGKSDYLQTELDPEEALYSRLPSVPSSTFKYIDKRTICESVPTASKADLSSKPGTSASLEKRRLSAPASSTENFTKSTNTQPTETTTTASQTDFIKENERIIKDSLEIQSSKALLQAVPSIHEIKPLERRSSLRSSSDGDEALVGSRSKVKDKPMPAEKSKNTEDVSSAKFTPTSSRKSSKKQLLIKDTDSTKGSTKSTPKSSSKQATKQAADTVSSSLPRSLSADRINQRSSIVDFDLTNRFLKSDPKEVPSHSSLSKNSHGSSSSSGSSDSIKNTQL